MAAIDQAMVSKLLNLTTPTGTSGNPGTTATGLAASPMKVRLNSAASTASAAGTEITGSGYVAGGTAVPAASAASSAGSAVTVPATSALSWTNASGGAWSIVSFDLTDSAGVRAWFGNFTGQPVSVANGNTFQIAVAGISLSLT
jgi:hypothetical protein